MKITFDENDLRTPYSLWLIKELTHYAKYVRALKELWAWVADKAAKNG